MVSAMTPFETRAEMSEHPTQAHLELRGVYSQVCGVCAVFREHNPYSAPVKFGLQLYGDYLPFAFTTPLGVVNLGPYGSISTVGAIEKIAAGLAMALRPEKASWEIFTQIGGRYTSEEIPYQHDGETGSQGKKAFNLAIGGRLYLASGWYVMFAYEHDSNGSHVGVPLSEKERSKNPGIDQIVTGLGMLF